MFRRGTKEAIPMDMTCENCGRRIGKLETPHVYQDHAVCAGCYALLTGPGARTVTSSPAPASAAVPYRALGLESRGMCLGIVLVGLLLSPLVVGIPLIVWGAVADWMLHKHRKAIQPEVLKQPAPKPMPNLPPPTNGKRW